ncbi:hypothetical protein Syn8016DRAFT_0790 [Synechococcus sp. WH 8016]|nr:hypothetical protein Syn8016DRAFT_0790 [Synechococcus sp. WH 8016]
MGQVVDLYISDEATEIAWLKVGSRPINGQV